jgi:hypothetical protein
LDDEIPEEIYKRNNNIILEEVNAIADTKGNMSRLQMWKVKQRICPKYENNVPVAKKDNNGNIICNRKELKELYVNVYQDGKQTTFPWTIFPREILSVNLGNVIRPLFFEKYGLPI